MEKYQSNIDCYSNKVDLGDIHKTNYMNNEFDILFVARFVYSNNFGTALDEMLWLLMTKIISIGLPTFPKKDKVRQFDKPDNVLESTSQILDKMKENIDHVYLILMRNNILQMKEDTQFLY